MRFAQINGNEDLKKVLSGMIDSGKIPHAILFHEEDGGGAFSLCLAFLQYLYCKERQGGDSCGECSSCNRINKLIHTDLHIIFPTISSQLSANYAKEFRELALSKPKFREADLASALKIEGKNLLISVAESRTLLQELSLSALEGGYRSVIIYLPEKMNAEAANKLLKMIEEPPAKTQFLLITHRPERVLTTIVSRCQRFRVVDPEIFGQESDFEQKELFDNLMDALINKDLISCLDISEQLAALPSRESAQSFCDYAAITLRQIFICSQNIDGNLSSLYVGEEKIARWAKSLKASFPARAIPTINNLKAMISRNVNLKVLFADMANKLYTLI